MTRKSLEKAPYDARGNLKLFRNGAHEWRPNEPFEATLTLDSTQRSYAASTYKWLDQEGHAYHMYVSHLADLVMHGTIYHGTVRGWWVVAKIGNGYGIRLAKPKDLKAAAHRGGNAEDCPACLDTNPAYPFICPGPEASA